MFQRANCFYACSFCLFFMGMNAQSSFNKNSQDNRYEIILSLNTVEKYFSGDEDIDKKLNTYIFARLGSENFETYKCYSVGLQLKYNYVKSSWIRLRLNFTNYYYSSDYDSQRSSNPPYPDIHMIDQNTIRLRSFNLSPGIAYKFNDKKISFYTGLELPVSFIGQLQLSGYSYQYTISSANLEWEYRYKTTLPKGFSIGLSPFFGSAVHFNKQLYASLECQLPFVYSVIRGMSVNQIDQIGPVSDYILFTTPVSSKYLYIDKGKFILSLGLAF